MGTAIDAPVEETEALRLADKKFLLLSTEGIFKAMWP